MKTKYVLAVVAHVQVEQVVHVLHREELFSLSALFSCICKTKEYLKVWVQVHETGGAACCVCVCVWVWPAAEEKQRQPEMTELVFSWIPDFFE